jgi:hypothetical protein
MLAGEKVDPKENLPGGSKGQARDKAAESVGMSGRTAEKLSVGRTLTLSLKTRPVSGILLKKKATGIRRWSGENRPADGISTFLASARDSTAKAFRCPGVACAKQSQRSTQNPVSAGLET